MNPPISMSDLASHLLIEVLSRLPIKTLIQCRCVCKAWLELLSGPEFIKQHLSRSPTSLIFNMWGHSKPPSDLKSEVVQLIELEDTNDHHDLHYDPAMIFDYSSIINGQKSVFLLGSSNGLILVNWLPEDGLCVCNPITREYISLPPAEGIRTYPNLVAHGFGYSCRNDQYKVIRIYQENTVDPARGSRIHRKSDFQVYTLGSGSRAWRSFGDVYDLSFGCYLPGVQLNGNLHWWVDDRDERELISSFNLDDESFGSLPLPPGLSHQYAGTLGVLDGRLCLCNNATDFELELWVMKEYGVGSSWSKEFVISKPGDYWLSYIYVHALTAFRDGEILFLYWDDTTFSYNPEKKTIKEYHDISRGGPGAMVDILSFVSLKNFVAEEVKKS